MTTEFTILEGEIFVDVRGFEGRFKISNFGRWMSTGGKTKLPNISTGGKDSCGYRSVYMRNKPNNLIRRLHCLVAEHFIPNPHNKPFVNHIDGNKINNHYSNLEWVTAKENSEHAISIGLHDRKGIKHHNHKLTEAKVKEMRALASIGISHRIIGEKFGVCRRQATDVINKVNWAWVD